MDGLRDYYVNEVSQTETDKYHMISLIREILTNNMNGSESPSWTLIKCAQNKRREMLHTALTESFSGCNQSEKST